jgi:hypothetical protein
MFPPVAMDAVLEHRCRQEDRFVKCGLKIIGLLVGISLYLDACSVDLPASRPETSMPGALVAELTRFSGVIGSSSPEGVGKAKTAMSL